MINLSQPFLHLEKLVVYFVSLPTAVIMEQRRSCFASNTKKGKERQRSASMHLTKAEFLIR